MSISKESSPLYGVGAINLCVVYLIHHGRSYVHLDDLCDTQETILDCYIIATCVSCQMKKQTSVYLRFAVHLPSIDHANRVMMYVCVGMFRLGITYQWYGKTIPLQFA